MRNKSKRVPKPFWCNENKYQLFDDRTALLNYSCSKIEHLDGDIAEFGVASGRTLQTIVSATKDSRRYFGFDSFEGMPSSKYPTKYAKGKFKKSAASFEKLKSISENITPVKGWFSDTLKSKHFDKLCFVHIDCDIYESTVLALEYCFPYFVNGLVIQFDEIASRKANFALHEYKAWVEFIDKYSVDYEVLGFTSRGQASFKINIKK